MMANYLILIYSGDQEAKAQGDEVSTAYREFMQRRAAALRGGAALESVETATSVRSDGGGGTLSMGRLSPAIVSRPGT